MQAEHGMNIVGVGLLTVSGKRADHEAIFFRKLDYYNFDCSTSVAQFDQVDRQDFQPLIASVNIV